MSARIQCFSGEWMDLDGVKLLLFKLMSESTARLPALPEARGSSSSIGSPTDVGELLRLPDLLRSRLSAPELKSECDLTLVELCPGSTWIYYLVSSKRLRCVPLAPVPDRVRSVEILTRGPAQDAVELDPLQRNMLIPVRRVLEASLYAPCLVGEAIDPGVVAVGVELLNYGSRLVTVEELTRTYVREGARSRAGKRIARRGRKKRA